MLYEKMYPEVYKEWISLFNDDFVQIWQNERKELQKISILLCALQKELKTVQTNVEIEVTHLKQKIKYKDDLEKKTKKILSPIEKKKSPSTVNKENALKNPIGLQPAGDFTRRHQTDKQSPDLFKDIDLNAHCSSTDISVIDLSISEDDTSKTEGSPTIKKRRKRYKFIPNPVVINTMGEHLEKPSTPLSTIPETVKTNLFKTPAALKSQHDLSVIECTPEMKRLKTSKVSEFISKKKYRNKKNNNTTLTQLFRRSSLKTKTKQHEDEPDSDETYFEESTESTKMGITDLIDYINKDESIKERNNSQRDAEDDILCREMETSSQEVDQFSRGAIFNDEDIPTSSEKVEVINIEPEPVVRGKARKQLHGWSCQNCKDFYGQMKLSSEEMQKKMDECSRHRYKYRPPEETIPGFWDLSIPPEN